MGKGTAIEWTDHSWPVVNGCRRISPGCGGPHGLGGCYAERLVSTRLRKTRKYEGLAEFTEGGPRWTGKSRLWVPDLWLPLRTRKPAKWFVANMGDLFFEEVSNEEIAAVFGVMAACPQHTFQVLTKRPKRMREWFEWVYTDRGFDHMQAGKLHTALCDALQGQGDWDPNDRVCEELLDNANEWPLANVWLGVSAENQETADERIPELLRTPAAVRFVSAEPLLGPVHLCPAWLAPYRTGGFGDERAGSVVLPRTDPAKVDWVIVGGESGPNARPMCEAWAESIIAQCRAAHVAVFLKQLGAYFCWGDEARPHHQQHLNDSKGGDMSEWPETLRVREFPEVRA